MCSDCILWYKRVVLWDISVWDIESSLYFHFALPTYMYYTLFINAFIQYLQLLYNPMCLHLYYIIEILYIVSGYLVDILSREL